MGEFENERRKKELDLAQNLEERKRQNENGLSNERRKILKLNTAEKTVLTDSSKNLKRQEPPGNGSTAGSEIPHYVGNPNSTPISRNVTPETPNQNLNRTPAQSQSFNRTSANKNNQPPQPPASVIIMECDLDGQCTKEIHITGGFKENMNFTDSPRKVTPRTPNQNLSRATGSVISPKARNPYLTPTPRKVTPLTPNQNLTRATGSVISPKAGNPYLTPTPRSVFFRAAGSVISPKTGNPNLTPTPRNVTPQTTPNQYLTRTPAQSQSFNRTSNPNLTPTPRNVTPQTTPNQY